MTDIVSREKRSQMMSGIRSKNTKPEMVVRRWLHKNGYRFRLHRKDLPGKPDIVLPKYKTVIFVHGCFWHRHEGCKNSTIPKSRATWWLEKLERNTSRDEAVMHTLRESGWRVLVVWECQVRNGTFVGALLSFFSTLPV